MCCIYIHDKVGVKTLTFYISNESLLKLCCTFLSSSRIVQNHAKYELINSFAYWHYVFFLNLLIYLKITRFMADEFQYLRFIYALGWIIAWEVTVKIKKITSNNLFIIMIINDCYISINIYELHAFSNIQEKCFHTILLTYTNPYDTTYL